MVMKYVAITVELVGTAVATVGLWNAYSRSRYAIGLWQRLMHGWLIWPKAGTGTAAGMYGWRVTAKGYAPFALDNTLQVEDQVAQLADYVRKLKSEIAQLDHEVEQVRTQASAAVSQALAKAKDDARDQIQSLGSRIDAAQVVDLRWASGGLAITAIGILLSYCS